MLPEYVGTLLMPAAPASIPPSALATGKSACPGIATGIASPTPTTPNTRGPGEAVILARPTTDPEDVAAMSLAAAVSPNSVDRPRMPRGVPGTRRPCVVGCGAGVLAALAGRTVTVDASTGAVYPGEITIVPPTTVDDPDLALLSRWVGAQSISGAPGSLPEMLRQRRMEQSR